MTWYIFDIQQTLDIIISFMYGKKESTHPCRIVRLRKNISRIEFLIIRIQQSILVVWPPALFFNTNKRKIFNKSVIYLFL